MATSIAVTGGRHFGERVRRDSGVYLERVAQRNFVRRQLRQLLFDVPGDVIVHVGDATGVDEITREVCFEDGYDIVVYYANWDQLGKFAGPERNRRILDLGRPSTLIVFPGGKGTANMKQQAECKGVAIVQPDYIARYRGCQDPTTGQILC